MTPSQPPTGSPLCDQRGSILIPGMAMGMILALCGMHVLDTTKAILLRTMGQNAADAIALESAVWHAQGMNIIVLINVIMAAIFSILVAVRVVEILLIAAIAILAIAAAVASFFSFGAAGQAATTMIRSLTQGLLRTQRFEDKISNPIVRTLTFATDAERTICAVMPYVALAHPVTLSNDVPGIPWSISLVPAVFEQKFSKFPNVPILQGDDGRGPKLPFKEMRIKSFRGTDGKDHKFEGFEVETSFPARLGTIVPPRQFDRWIAKKTQNLSTVKKNAVTEAVDYTKGLVGSLPVQEDDFYQVCGRAAELMSATLLHVLGGPVGLDTAAIEKVTSFVAVVVGSLPTLMCTPIKSVNASLQKELTSAVDKKCDDERSAWESDSNNKGKKYTAQQAKACKDREAKNAKLDASDSEDIKIGRLWGLMTDPKESPFLHVWSVVHLDSKLDVEAANAMAEFRHVCDNKGDAAKRSCAENSMWSNGWFAKLVPVRDVRDEMRMKIGDLFAGWFSRALGKAITGLVDNALRHVPKAGASTSALSNGLHRLLGTALGPKAANGWWNRRLASGRAATWISKWSELNLTRYPEYLH